MNFNIGKKVNYKGIDLTITGVIRNKNKSVFEAQAEIEQKDYIILFDKNGYVLPFTENTPNEEKVVLV